MRNFFFIVLACLSVKSSVCQQMDKMAVRRIADYGKLWVVVTLFHPEMAYNRVNADSLFTDNINDLLAEPSATNFTKAVEKLLEKLRDPYTIIESKKTQDTFHLPDYPLLTWLDDSIARLHFDLPFINESFRNSSLSSLIDTLKNARGLVIDLRDPFRLDEYSAYYKNQFFTTLMSYLIDRPMNYPAYRTRMHYGHESQSFTSEFYFQGWFLQNSSVINPGPKALHKPFCLLVNRYNSDIAPAVIAMQNAGIAKVIGDGNLDNFEAHRIYPLSLADNVKVNIRLTEVVYPNGGKTFSPDAIFQSASLSEDTVIRTAVKLIKRNSVDSKPGLYSGMQNQFISSKVSGYENLPYPPASLRLLGLMRYWAAINYFCPNKNLITKNWDSVLYEYTPQFLQAKDSLQYALTAARLIKEINDGHGFFGSPVHSKMITDAPEVQLAYIENKTIVYRIFNDSLKKILSVGDEVIAVNEIPIKKWRDSIGQYIGASNDAALQRDITSRVLAGGAKTSVAIGYLHNGTPKTTRLFRTVPWYKYTFNPSTSQSEPIWKKLPNKIGYVDFGRLQVEQIDSMFQDLYDTDALIIDNRSYPKGTVWTMISYLTDKSVKSAKGTTMIADSPDPSSVTVQSAIWEIPVTPKRQYKGSLIILVNELTQSQAEYSCMVLQAASKKVTIIGSQTAGADGDVTGILLPGGIRTSFSGHGVYYPDGRPTQGIGIVPDIKIKPTIRGIKTGKDEVLERAIVFAKTGK